MTSARTVRLAFGAAVAFTLAALAPAPAAGQFGGDWDRLRCESTDRRETYCRAAIGGDVPWSLRPRAERPASMVTSGIRMRELV